VRTITAAMFIERYPATEDVLYVDRGVERKLTPGV